MFFYCLLLLFKLTSQSCGLELTANAEELLPYFKNAEPRIKPENLKTTHQRIIENGYPAETHQLTTTDGYMLDIFRIPYSRKLKNQSSQSRRKPAVLLQHGLFGSSDSWLLLGPEHSFAFMLADAGFDVWLGNSRGNFYARKNENISTYKKDFWHFSWHEIGYYDLPAIIDYALNNTDEESLHYIGYSQGTTAGLVMLTTRPEYNAKLKMAHLLAPVAYVGNMSDKLVRTLAPILGRPSSLESTIYTSQEFLPQNKLFMKLSYNACLGYPAKIMGLCSAIAHIWEGSNKNMNKTAVSYLIESHPAGCSTNQIIHYMQEQQNKRFCAFDYGAKENLNIYGQKGTPDYPLKNIKIPLHLWYSDNDKLATPRDVARLSTEISNGIMHHINDADWAHGHFILNNNLSEVIHKPVINILRNFEETPRE